MNLTLPHQAQKIIDTFQKAGYEIYIVGGVVRDALLNTPLYDWDFTTNATPEQILALFPDGFYDNKFGTVGLENAASGRPYEITTYRSEGSYSDFRHPDKISWGKTLAEDLKRRDFTINAMALRPAQGKPMEVIDPFGGQKDLQNKSIRAVGNPEERFGEDSLRMMRAVRIAAQLGFIVETKTLAAIQKHAQNITKISVERVRDELLKLMASLYPADGYLLLRNSGLSAYILPDLEGAFGVEQKSPGRHHIYDVGTHSVESLRHCPSSNPITRLATLIHDVGKVKTQKVYPDGKITFYNHEMVSAKIAKRLADDLRFSNAQKDLFIRLVRWHQFTVDEHQTDSAIRRFIRNVGRENVDEMLALRTGDRLGGGARETSWRLEDFKRRIEEVQKLPFSVADLKINGRDVMEIKKVPPGPMVGQYLNMLFKKVEKEGIKNEKKLLIKELNKLTL